VVIALECVEFSILPNGNFWDFFICRANYAFPKREFIIIIIIISNNIIIIILTAFIMRLLQTNGRT